MSRPLIKRRVWNKSFHLLFSPYSQIISFVFFLRLPFFCLSREKVVPCAPCSYSTQNRKTAHLWPFVINFQNILRYILDSLGRFTLFANPWTHYIILFSMERKGGAAMFWVYGFFNLLIQIDFITRCSHI